MSSSSLSAWKIFARWLPFRLGKAPFLNWKEANAQYALVLRLDEGRGMLAKASTVSNNPATSP